MLIKLETPIARLDLLGGACFSHGPYTFYKAVRIGNGRVLRLGSFFLTKLWTDADLVSIGELQLLWIDSRGSNQPLASLRLYFLPENTPDGRRDTHGEDEVLTISEKVVVRVHDLVTWLAPSLEWSWGREVSFPTSSSVSGEKIDEKFQPQPQVLTDPGIDFSDVEKQQKDIESSVNNGKKSEEIIQTRVVVLSYPRYCRYRALLRRLEGAEPAWLYSSIAAALGGFTALPGTRVLFCRDTFDYPDLETHELLCNHLAPKLKGRPRRKRKKRSASPGESSNESEASVASTSRSTTSNSNMLAKGPSNTVRRSERKASVEEKKFLADVQNFMSSRGTPVTKMPLLGYRQIDLYVFYTKVQKLGGYDSVSAGRLWKSIYDDMGGHTGSTSAATITRRHYERLLLPYERHQKGSETKVRPAGRRTKSTSDEPIIIKTEATPSPPRTPSSTPPMQKLFTTTSHLPDSDKPKTEVKTSSLRSVRVKPERLKSLNTIISSMPSSNPPTPPPSSNASNTSSTSITPSTTPTESQSVLERQLNSPLINNQQSPPTPPAQGHQITQNPSTVVTLTPPPEKDLKELKLETQNSKQTTLMAQGKENIPLFGERAQFITTERINPPKSPEVIDLELESDSSRDKIIIPSFKKRKLEILREGGLEVTAVELDSRPSVIQATITPVTVPIIPKRDDDICSSPTRLSNSTVPKLISVTVTPDIGHMLPSPGDNEPQVRSSKTHNNNNSSVSNNNRVINLGASNNSNLLQLYASSGSVPTSPISPGRYNSSGERILPPKVTQSKSIFGYTERMVYGNPKDVLAHQKYQQTAVVPPPTTIINHAGGVLDLTAKQLDKSQSFNRPNLEIVRVPVVPRPNPMNLELKSVTIKEKIVDSSRKSPFNYPMLDSRTMASNNLEITLVSPKTKPQAQLPSPVRNGNSISTVNNVNLNLQNQRMRMQNGKLSVRPVDGVSPYTSRKPPQQVIPNIPNLNHLTTYPLRGTNSHQIAAEKRKNDTREQQLSIENAQKAQRQDRRHSMPNISSGFPPSVSHNSGYVNQLPNAGKYLPGGMGMLDPVYYSAICSGLFPPPMSPASPYLPPEFNAYYKELLGGQARVTAMGQPTIPTSK
ncbi:AT-rich interactive domain-containing protein 5B-like isoform X2 [Diachasmimorpha longicaudata]|uniref:AT-rich interactive domain-containing protein 5B-like isoform X2 n=1 Tax=Diachasmimorpha longicaudata TaxID=58733 RepID=UPI0030B8C363